ncbi:MAG TPA: 3-isopropylmalate dehydratase small subunit [Candidatus Angelobacter sp.]|nr:3-isopropylmalate dehydratase small subunit [Candidatus Angelobacter sp.]
MQSFRTHTGVAAVLARENVDTDQIIPKQFLKRIERTGYGDALFFGWRYDAQGNPDPNFPLNAPMYSGASILIAGKNFGCGSSREHAAWALRDFGFRAILAPSFADIFSTNCVKNGLLLVTLGEKEIAQLTAHASAQRASLTVDLEKCQIASQEGFATEFKAEFKVDAFKRMCLLEGLDEIGMTLKRDSDIGAYESRRPSFMSRITG